jgi:hypothetical protein
MHSLLFLVLFVVLSACGESAKEPQAPSKPRDVTYEVYKDGAKLGVIVIKAGSFGEFTPLDVPGAKEFLEKWEKEKARGHVSVRMHMPTKDGSRGAYGAQMYKPTEGSYADGVKYFLMDQNYTGVEVPSEKQSTSTPTSSSQPTSQKTP